MYSSWFNKILSIIRLMHVGFFLGHGKQSTAAPSTSDLVRYISIAFNRLVLTIGRIQECASNFSDQIQKIGLEIRNQKRFLEKTEKSSMDANTLFTGLRVHSCKILDSIKKALHLSQTAKQDLQKTITGIEGIIGLVKRFNTVVLKFKEQSKSINSITNIIVDFADKTKTISLNSYLLSSKAAGTRSLSFKVVAEEIKKLSVEIANKTQSIDGVIADVGTAADSLTGKMTESILCAEETKTAVEEAFAAINGAVQTITESAGFSRDINTMAVLCEKKSGSIIEMLKTTNKTTDALITNHALCTARKDNQHRSIRTLQEIVSGTSIVPTIDATPAAAVGAEKTLAFPDSPIVRYDPAVALYTYERNFVLYQNIRLVKHGKNGSIVPFLAETWTLDDDEKTWHFKIRKNILFTSGKEITADDVKFSLERILHPNLKSEFANVFRILQGADQYEMGSAKEVSGIKINDPYTITFYLKNPYNYFLSMLAQPYTSIIEKSADHAGRLFRIDELKTAGPFAYAGYDEEHKCHILKANHRYINGRPYLDTVRIYRDIQDPFDAFKKKMINMFFAVPKKVQDEIRSRNDGASLITFQSKRINGLKINFSKNNYITRNKRIRHALWHAIDKKRILAEVYHHHAVPANTIIHDSILMNTKEDPFPFDPARAREIVDSFRKTEDMDAPVSILMLNNPKLPFLAGSVKIIAENLSAIGLNVSTPSITGERPPMEEYLKHDLCYMGYTPEVDLYLALEPFINPDGGDNLFFYNNPETFKALNDSLTIKDPSARKRYFLQFMDKVCDDAFYIPVVHLMGSCLVSPEVNNCAVLPDTEDCDLETIWIDPRSAGGERSTPGGGKMPGTGIDAVSDEGIRQTGNAINDVRRKSVDLINAVDVVITLAAEQQKTIAVSNDVAATFIIASTEADRHIKTALQTVMTSIETTDKSEKSIYTIKKTMENLHDSMGGIVTEIGRFTEYIKKISDTMQQIRQTVKIINSIAINAAIIGSKEETGKEEFNAISNEIRALSTNAEEETMKINDILCTMNTIAEEVMTHSSLNLSNIALCIGYLDKGANKLLAVKSAMGDAGSLSDTIKTSLDALSLCIASIAGSIKIIKESSAHIGSIGESAGFGSKLQSSILEVVDENFMDYSALCRETCSIPRP